MASADPDTTSPTLIEEGDSDGYDVNPDMPEGVFLGPILTDVMGQYFEYRANDGSSLNVADILLLIKHSIDKNTEVQQKLLEKFCKK